MTISNPATNLPVEQTVHLWLIRRAAQIVRRITADSTYRSDQWVQRLINAEPRQLACAGFRVSLDDRDQAVLLLDLSPQPHHPGDTEQRLAHELGLPCGLNDCTDCRKEDRTS